MRPGKASLVIPVLLTLLPALALAARPDLITAPLDSAQVTALRGNVHGLARPQFDLGRTDGSKLLSGVSIVFKPSVAQQNDLNKLLADQQNPSSPRYHKWLTPAQFADRFGMTRNDIQKVTAWLQSQGFTVTRVANSRNQIFFEGTVAQIEFTFHTEMHEYLVDGEVHFANATEPSVPSALAGSTLGIQNLHNFEPRARLHPHFTSHVTGEHFISPSDFTTIYDLQGLYSTVDGTGQKIAVTGQSNILLTDVANFRSAAGLSVNAPTLTTVPGTGSTATCPGDEGESDLDVEFSGGIAKNASITLYVAGLGSGTTCGNRTAGAFDALTYIIDNNVAPIISNSYGLCEPQIGGPAAASAMQAQAQQANTQGQTIISASGDSGAADCDFHVTSATHGLAVDMPAAIPEVTGAGGTEFTGDSTSCPPTGCPGNTAPADPPYWSGSGVGTDTISSALEYIPEMAWNDTAFDILHGGFISASGGGASTFFPKPTWQTGTGVPNDTKRDVPDISVSASADHDGYLFCSEDGPNGTKVATCTSGFRDASGNLAAVGGTSAAAPTLAGTLALINQFLGNTPPGGLGNINPVLYQFAASTPAAFNDVPSGSDNMVPCTKGSTGCPASGSYGFTTGVGYDQVTGLGSVNAFKLAQAWLPTQSPTTTSLLSSTTQITLGQSVVFTANVTPSVSGYVNFLNGTTILGNGTLDNTGKASFSTTSLPGGTATITAAYAGSGSSHTSTSSAISVTVNVPTFTLTPDVSTLTVQPGQSTNNTVTLAVASSNGFVVGTPGNQSTVMPVNYLLPCTVSPAVSEGPTCMYSPSAGSNVTVINPTVAILTTAPTAKLLPPFQPRSRIFYAMLLPGFLGIVLAAGSRPRALRVLGLMAVLGSSTLWLGACGGSNSSSQKNPGAPAGSYTVTVNATTNSTPQVKSSATFTVTVQ